ncbi:MAG: acyl-CoA dehydrogenase [Proteobacteria bacterium]|nr:acyl-CoA dehydrogenase [Pseudomonadota bacterium]
MGINFFRRDDRDIKFVIKEHNSLDKILSYTAYQDFTVEDMDMVIDESLKVGREVMGPANQDGDRIGAVYNDGVVTLPKSFHECAEVMRENGWWAVSNSPEFGGQGLPQIVGGMVLEIFCGANLNVMAYPGLTVGAGRLVENHGTDEDKALFVEKMYTGVWGGTMCLTEPDAGSDVGWLRTRAVPDPDSGDPRVFKIEGSKCFISAGEHDLCENIIHLLLARIEGAMPGTKGISLFIVPKIWVNPDGSLGEPNDVRCTGIEKKMGIHGSATASLSFGENGKCRGILLGEPHSGMPKMFQMMNESRLGVGLQGHAVAASAYDTARIYAKERIQGPPFTDRRGDRVPIIKHEDVRRMLMNLKAGTEGMRALCARTFFLLDVAEKDPNEETRRNAERQVELLTPVVKSYCADLGYELTRDAIQVLGGVGYCAEFPVEQYARDAKIASVYEGTNYIQAVDLIGRKMNMQGGRVFQEYMEMIMDFVAANREDADFAADVKLLDEATGGTMAFAQKFAEYFMGGKPQMIPLYATRFLDNLGEVMIGHLMLEQGLISRKRLAEVKADSADGIFYRGKIETAKYFCRNMLTRVFGRLATFQTEDTSALDIPEEAF